MSSLPCGVRNFRYSEDMAIVRTKTQWALLAVFLVFLFTLPLYLNNYWLGISNLIGITLIAAIGLNLLVGYCGQLSIGHAGFIAVGAYTSAVLSSKLGLPFPQDVHQQLWGAIGAVFGSWNAEKAVTYRRVEKITGLLGTAVNVVQMVFGNMNFDDASHSIKLFAKEVMPEFR